jgi:predicted dehydrogenase
VEDSCPYNCRKLYYDDKNNAWFRGACTRTFSQTDKPTDEEVMRALSTTDYGLCVYHANNDVVDHQVVNMEFEDGCTVSFTMNAFNEGGRGIHIFGTKGELVRECDAETLRYFSFESQKWETIDATGGGNDVNSGHGGGDTGIMIDILALLRGETPSNSVCEVRTSYENHLIGFAAEKARLENRVVSLKEFDESI